MYTKIELGENNFFIICYKNKNELIAVKMNVSKLSSKNRHYRNRSIHISVHRSKSNTSTTIINHRRQDKAKQLLNISTRVKHRKVAKNSVDVSRIDQQQSSLEQVKTLSKLYKISVVFIDYYSRTGMN